MTITVTNEAPSYDPRRIKGRYVKFNGGDGGFTWCETGHASPTSKHIYDLRQGVCDEDDLPGAVAVAARERREEGVWPFYVPWPITATDAPD